MVEANHVGVLRYMLHISILWTRFSAVLIANKFGVKVEMIFLSFARS